ncbi:hypothetical protein [Pseudonocardia sp. NPDC049635]|uniref:hypothetical protein n=1 Tax=Pseudonocardia sp. NPDC049635 TaxID=3155506 RepID=UPI0033F2BE0B
MLRDALDAPGVRYACVADPGTGQVVAAHVAAATVARTPADGSAPAVEAAGPAEGVPGGVAVVLGWAGAETATPAGARFEDAVITTGATYHLVRTLHRDGATLLAYLQVDRVRGNLALARRALLALPSNPTTVPVQGSAPAAERIPPAAIPLPRRAPAGQPPPAPAPTSTATEPPDRPGSRWSDDLRTMARILTGLRRLDRPSATES